MLKLPKLLVTCNNFTISLVLPAFDYGFIHLESSRLLQSGITPEKKCGIDYCFSLALFIFPIMFTHLSYKKTEEGKSILCIYHVFVQHNKIKTLNKKCQCVNEQDFD